MRTEVECKNKTSLKSNLDIFTQETRKKSGETRGWHWTVKDLVATNEVPAQSPLCFCNPWQGSIRSESWALCSLLVTWNRTPQEVNFLLSQLKLSVTYSSVKAQDDSNIWHPYGARLLLGGWLEGKGGYFKILIQTELQRAQLSLLLSCFTPELTTQWSVWFYWQQ